MTQRPQGAKKGPDVAFARNFATGKARRGAAGGGPGGHVFGHVTPLRDVEVHFGGTSSAAKWGPRQVGVDQLYQLGSRP